MANSRVCSIDDCDKPAKGRGWCAGHYHRWQRYGDPLAGGTVYGAPARFLAETVLSFDNPTPCLLWPFGRAKSGYGEIRVGGKTRTVHSIVCEAANGPKPFARAEAAHSCGNGHLGCVNPLHLRWATRRSNKDDELKHGTRNRGTKNGTWKLTEDAVRRIRELGSMAGANYRRIAEQFGVSDTSVRDIVHRRTWQWLI